MASNSNAATKRIRTEYMKKFRDPKWETFNKSYQDSLKYRLSRRLMEQAHRPLFGDGWDSGSDSSGRSSPRLRAVAESSPSNPPVSSSESRYESAEPQVSEGAQVNGEPRVDDGDATAVQNSLPVENGYQHVTDNGPSAITARERNRVPRSKPTFPRHDFDTDESTTDVVLKKPSRAKSQPPSSARERNSNRDNRRSYIRYDWAEKSVEARERRRPNMRGSVSAGEIHRSDVGVQTRRESEKRGKALDRRRARSADLEKLRRSELSTASDRWTTEYMRCFSARLS